MTLTYFYNMSETKVSPFERYRELKSMLSRSGFIDSHYPVFFEVLYDRISREEKLRRDKIIDDVVDALYNDTPLEDLSKDVSEAIALQFQLDSDRERLMVIKRKEREQEWTSVFK